MHCMYYSRPTLKAKVFTGMLLECWTFVKVFSFCYVNVKRWRCCGQSLRNSLPKHGYFSDNYLKSYNNVCKLFANVAENEKKRNHKTVLETRTSDYLFCLHFSVKLFVE